MAEIPERENISGSEIVGTEAHLVQAKVLFITEKAHDATPLERNLQSLGYSIEVKRVDSFVAFKEALKSYSPDIVMVELNLPGFDGVKALDYLKSSGSDIPLILMSGHDADGAGQPNPKELKRLSDSLIQILKSRSNFSSDEQTANSDSLISELDQVPIRIEDRGSSGVTILDSNDFNVLDVDEIFSGMTGFSRIELKRMRSIMRLVAAADLVGFEKYLQSTDQLDANGGSIVVRIIRRNGLLKQLLFTAKEYYWNDKRRIAMIAQEATNATGSPSNNETRSHGEADTPYIAVFDIDGEGKVRNWNPGATQMTGFLAPEILKMDLAALLKQDADAGTMAAAFVDGSTYAERIELPAWITRKDGVRFHACLTLTRLFDAVGMPSGFSVFLSKKAGEGISEERFREREAQLHSLTSHLQAAREDEKARIARQLHDEFSQTLTALRMDLSILGRMIARTVSEPLGRASLLEKISSVSEILEKAIRSARDMITELRPAVLDELGLLTAIQWQVLEFENRSGVNCHITNLQHGVSFEPVISTAIFRILQEALDNVKRHSSATDAFISLQVADSTLVLEVSDNGVGIRPDKIKSPDSIGIISIRERVHSLGGKLEVRGEPGHGTTLIVSIPLSK